MTDIRPVTVHGGGGGIEARYDDLTAAARVYGAAAVECGQDSLVLHRWLVDPQILAGAVLDPLGAGEFTVQLAGALDGPRGLTVTSASCAATDAHLRAAAAAYLGADRLAEQVGPALKGVAQLPRSTWRTLPALSRLKFGAAVDTFLTSDPEAADLVVDQISRFWTDYTRISLVARWPDGRPKVQARGVDPDGVAGRAPRSMRDLLAGLSRRNGGRGGDVDVRFLTTQGANGDRGRRVVVDVPGTKNWSLSPRQPDVTSLGTNLRALTGASTTYERGVVEAMRIAGVRAGDEVLFVGHSQGGMVAVDAARHLTSTREFHVAGVLTAGSPLARLPVPRAVTVMALENDGDVIPHCDGADNQDRTNVTTVRIHRNRGDPIGDHELSSSYVDGAADVDASDDRSIRAVRERWAGFLAATTVRTEVFHVSRI